MFSQVKLTLAGIAIAVILSTVGYIKVLQMSNDSKDRQIVNYQTAIIVDIESDQARDLTNEFKIDIITAKGETNEVEINTSIGTHSISFK